MFGLKTMGANAGGVIKEVFAKKPTKFMTNSARMAEELTRRCRGLHAHQRLMGGKAHQKGTWAYEAYVWWQKSRKSGKESCLMWTSITTWRR